MKNIKRLLLSLPILLIAAYLFISWSLSNRILYPKSSIAQTKSRIANHWGTTYEAMLATLPEAEDFSVNSFDGTSIKGKYFQTSDSSKCAVIISHGWTGTWAGMLKYVPVLSDCQCDLAMYDHRSHGQSGDAYPTGGINEAKDLLAVTEWVEKNKGYAPRQIGWLGASWGGATVLSAGADPKNVGFIIADAPFQDWYSAIFERAIRDYGSAINLVTYGVMKAVNWRTGINYEDASVLKLADKIEEPVLLIHSQTDSQTDSRQSVNISRKLNPKTSTFYHLDWGGDHTEDVRINKERFQELVNEFLAGIEEDFLKK